MTEVVPTMKDKNGREFGVDAKLRSAKFPDLEVKCILIEDGKAHLSKDKKELPIIINQETLNVSQWEVPGVARKN